MTNPTNDDRLQVKQLKLLGLVLVPVLALLLAGYFLLVKERYAPLAEDLRPAEANAVVAELRKQDIAYRLENQGRTILVPAERADELRLSMSGGAVGEAGSVGFELFNESDLGLTDFAQKINYQRALQGELARTIMGMDGIAHARVHLALPERSLFRASRSEPRAAVTIVPRTGVILDAGRVAGIQRLVASTVTDLKIENVSVLNQRGQLVTAEPEFAGPNRMASATMLEKAYAERVGKALAAAAPDLGYGLRVTTVPAVPDGSPASSPEIFPPDQRDYSVRVVLFTSRPVAPDRQSQLEQAIADAIGTTPAAGDDIQFSLEPRVPAPEVASSQAGEAALRNEPDGPRSTLISGPWIEIAAFGAAAIAGLALLLMARRRRLRRRELLYVRLRDQLLLEHGA